MLRARRPDRSRRQDVRSRAQSRQPRSRPTHSSTECAPRPPVSSRTRSTASSPRSLTTSVAPNSSPSAMRSGWRPSRMICSAPRRLAAITPQRPTAPSPMTATVFPGATFATTAAWWPVPITSDSVSSDGISASSSPTGSTTSVPSACGTRTASPWPPSTSSRAVATAMQARGLQPFAAELAGAVRPEERRQHQIAGLDRAHLGADGLDDADELVSHAAAGVARRHRLVRPQVAAADAGARHPHQRVGRLDQMGVGNVLDADVAGAVHQRCAHSGSSFARKAFAVRVLSLSLAARECGRRMPPKNGRYPSSRRDAFSRFSASGCRGMFQTTRRSDGPRNSEPTSEWRAAKPEMIQ